ncbi:uncharacterized protein TNCV_2069031 [Trichonephila clavipes]|uniref:Uncharacterized protein n=1 Tax=Trichonephila clavipes TaxID=2585209 RepID=A0A8X6W343_TRICX|nr:uncharacterized protein TNCV_2069031 [Trichonephila clavipes]
MRRFVEWAQNEIAVVPDFHKRILLSDEAHFWLNGYVNKQNCRIWSEANPQVYFLQRDPSWVSRDPRKVTVAHFRLLTGHDCLRSHLDTIGISNSPDCTLNGSGHPMTAEHLVVCPALISLNSIVEEILESTCTYTA